MNFSGSLEVLWFLSCLAIELMKLAPPPLQDVIASYLALLG